MMKQVIPKEKEIEVFLFSDLLLWVNAKHKFKGYISFGPMSIPESQFDVCELKRAAESNNMFSIEFHYTVANRDTKPYHVVWVIRAQSVEERSAWLKEVLNACETIQRAAQTLSAPAHLGLKNETI